MQFSTASSPIPAAVGMTAAAAVQPILPRFLLYRQQCCAARRVHQSEQHGGNSRHRRPPLPESTSERAAYELISVRQLPEVYAISIIGITSSFAGSPK